MQNWRTIIRKAKVEDIPDILILWKEFMHEHDNIILNKNPKLKPYLIRKNNATDIMRKFIQKNIKTKNSVVYIANVKSKPAGYCLALIKDNIAIFNLSKIGYISDLFVKKEYRRKNISSEFKNIVIRWLKDRKIKHISLVVKKDNKFAYSVYKKWGFFDYHIEMRKKL